MEIDEINNNTKQKPSTRRRSRFRFSFTNEEEKSRLFRTHSASIINPENVNQIYSSRRRKSYSTTGLANELKNIIPNEQIINLDKVFFFSFKIQIYFFIIII
jgi:hypothetical protein